MYHARMEKKWQEDRQRAYTMLTRSEDNERIPLPLLGLKSRVEADYKFNSCGASAPTPIPMNDYQFSND